MSGDGTVGDEPAWTPTRSAGHKIPNLSSDLRMICIGHGVSALGRHAYVATHVCTFSGYAAARCCVSKLVMSCSERTLGVLPSGGIGAGSQSIDGWHRVGRFERPGARIACRQPHLSLTLCLLCVFGCICHISYAVPAWPVLRHLTLVDIVANTFRCRPRSSFLHGEKGSRTRRQVESAYRAFANVWRIR